MGAQTKGWETVEIQRAGGPGDGFEVRTERLRVHGGWLYRTQMASLDGIATALAFVPIPPIEVKAPDSN